METKFKLLIVTFLDSICYGLIYGFISPYVLSLGADHLVVGLMSVGNLLCSLISADIIKNINQGKQETLLMILSTTMVSYLLMISTGSYWWTIFSRYIFSLMNQSQNLCKDILLQNVPTDERDRYLTKYSILSGAGYVIGPFISGMLFDIGFFYIGVLAATLTAVNSYIIMSLLDEPDDSVQAPERVNVGQKAYDNINGVIQNFNKCDYKTNWDILALKFLYISSMSIFFAKFTQLLKHNFQASAYCIGVISSYMNGVTFVGAFIVRNMKDKYSRYPTIKLTEYALQLLVVSTLVACYSPCHYIYIFMCIPIIFPTNYINSVWRDLFEARKNESLNELNGAVAITAGLTVPLIFGVVCNYIGHHAVIMFSILPLLSSLYIIRRHTSQYIEQGDKTKVE